MANYELNKDLYISNGNIQLNNITNLHTYSTSEKVIGKWKDGKTLYCKTIYSTSTTGSLGISGIDFLRYKNLNISIDNFLFSSDRNTGVTGDKFDFFVNKVNRNFTFTPGSSWSNGFNYIVFDIEYTKK